MAKLPFDLKFQCLNPDERLDLTSSLVSFDIIVEFTLLSL